MSKPAAKNNLRPSREINRKLFPISTYITRLAERLVWDFTEVGDGTIAGKYYGRTLNNVQAQGRALVAHYFEHSKSGQGLALEAVALAANMRLKTLQLAGVIQPAELGEPVIYMPRPRSSASKGAAPLDLRRTKNESAARRYMDSNPESSYRAVDTFLFEQPGKIDLLNAAPIVDYLVQHSAIDMERRLILGGTYEAMTMWAGVRTSSPAAPDYLRLTKGRP